MRIVIAPGEFKGTLTARQAAEAIAAGWRRSRPDDHIETVPVSDGGPGFIDAVAADTAGRAIAATTRDPLGRPTTARLFVAGATCYVESADCCGLHLVPPSERNPLNSSSAGLADLLRSAAATSASRVVVGLGGSATNDGGAGMLDALGFQLVDGDGRRLAPVPASLERLARVVSRPDPLGLPDLVAAYDVDSPLVGPEGASAVFGPQKGASPRDVDRLEAGLVRLADVLGRDVPGAAGLEDREGAGAAGGLGYGLFVLGSSGVPGAELVIEATRLAERMEEADLVVTGEGSFDHQSLRGKVVAGVARLARKSDRRCVVLAGVVRVDRAGAARAGVSAAYSITDLAGSPDAARAEPRRHLESLAAKVASIE